jgi:hypothetical protein
MSDTVRKRKRRPSTAELRAIQARKARNRAINLAILRTIGRLFGRGKR